MKHISILGGGPAGLAVGYYAKKSRLPFTVYEAKALTGGNCITFRHKEFFFDSGAHRFHDKIEEITKELRGLLGEDLRKISVPSVIFHEGRTIHFPLSPLDLLKKLGPGFCLRAARQVMVSRLTPGKSDETFADYATRLYGGTIASAFLLNYTEKLFGRPCSRLSPGLAGERLNGLHLRAFLSQAFSWRHRKAVHMEGSFYYPRTGIGAIADKLVESCGAENIRTLAKITRVLHDHERIRKVEINGKDLVEVEEVASTLPIDYFLRVLEPAPPPNILTAAENLNYRALVLVALSLNKPSVTPYATIYSPGAGFPQTRTYEPRNRSLSMSPQRRTSLVAEIPCQEQDDLWRLDDGSWVEMIASHLTREKWIVEEDVMGASVIRLDHAYPILDLGFEKHVRVIMDYLDGFGNLRLSGRNAEFVYGWIHNMLKAGQEIVRDYTQARPSPQERQKKREKKVLFNTRNSRSESSCAD